MMGRTPTVPLQASGLPQLANEVCLWPGPWQACGASSQILFDVPCGNDETCTLVTPHFVVALRGAR